jgi:hypothetical protein
MRTIHTLRSPISTTQDLSSGALNYTTSIARPFKLEEITIHFSVAVTETITVKRNSNIGANYDTVLADRDMVAEQDFVFRPQGECNFLKGDEIDIDITNANTTGVAYVEIKTSEM